MAAYGWLETFWQDVRLAARGLRKSPGFLAVVVLIAGTGDWGKQHDLQHAERTVVSAAALQASAAIGLLAFGRGLN